MQLYWVHHEYDYKAKQLISIEMEACASYESCTKNHLYSEKKQCYSTINGLTTFWNYFDSSREVVFVDRYFDEQAFERFFKYLKQQPSSYNGEKRITILTDKRINTVKYQGVTYNDTVNITIPHIAEIYIHILPSVGSHKEQHIHQSD